MDLAPYIEEVTHLLTDPAHWTFELISDLVFAVPAYMAGMWKARRMIARHDAEVHAAISPDHITA